LDIHLGGGGKLGGSLDIHLGGSLDIHLFSIYFSRHLGSMEAWGSMGGSLGSLDIHLFVHLFGGSMEDWEVEKHGLSFICVYFLALSMSPPLERVKEVNHGFAAQQIC
jgi:hypothetical protein